MSVPIKYLLAATCLLTVALVNDARAQVELPFGPANYDHNLQLFAPLELDLNNLPDQETYGYFFNYDRLYWSYTGEHVTVGDPNVEVLAERIYIQNQQDEGTLPEPYQVKNGLQDVVPNAGFAWGNRYEVGYEDGQYGWTIGILDGPQLIQNQTYGFGSTPPLGTDYTDNAGDPLPGPPQAGGDLRAFGFGNVHVNFETPPGYLEGFRDYVNFLAGALLGTQGGPALYVGNYGLTFEPGTDDTTITFFRLADDINENGIAGATVVVDEDGNIIALVTDFGDLHQFNIAFDSVNIRSTTDMDGVELMWTQELTNQHYQAKNQNNRLQLAYGARFLRLDDEFRVSGIGSVLGDSFWDTSLDNQIVGPQVAMKWVNQRERWTLTTDARFMFGYNVQDWSQVGGIGSQLIPGALNRPAYAQPTYFTHSRAMQGFSPVGELRVEMAYKLTQSFVLTAGYTGSFIGNIRRAAPSVRYTLPDMGYRDAGTQNLLVNGLDFGVEFHH
jgi:Putative beta barrel porin-7 (BBP7)